MKDKLIPLEHPGTFLKEEFMDPLGVRAHRLAKDTGIQPMAISEILRGNAASPDERDCDSPSSSGFPKATSSIFRFSTRWTW